jgi:outer membrane protein assembly factor BamB
VKPNPNSAVVWHTRGPIPADLPKIVGKKKDRHLSELRDFYFGRTIASVTVHDGLVYAAELGGYVFCFDAKTGKAYWFDDLKASVWGQPLWADGKVFVTTDGGDIFIYAHGKEKKRLTKIEWENATRPGLVFANGTLYVTTDTSLYAIRNPK